MSKWDNGPRAMGALKAIALNSDNWSADKIRDFARKELCFMMWRNNDYSKEDGLRVPSAMWEDNWTLEQIREWSSDLQASSCSRKR